jgi:hypothetical protein
VSTVSQFALFLSSYAPLFGVFALLNSFGRGLPTIVCLVLTAAGVVILPILLHAARKLPQQPLAASTTQIRDGDALAYIATYIVPFAAMAGTTPQERGAIALFVALIAVLYVRAGLFYINPLLALVGYQLFQVITPAGASVVVITPRRFVSTGTDIAARRLGEYVYWEARS